MHRRLRNLTVWSIVAFLGACSSGKTGTDLFGREVQHFSDSTLRQQIAWSPDSKMLAVAGGGKAEIRLWDVNLGREIWRTPAGPPGADCLSFTADGQSLITRSTERSHLNAGRGTITLRSVATGEVLRDLEDERSNSAASACALSEDGKSLAVLLGQSGRVAIYDTASWQVLARVGPVLHKSGAPYGLGDKLAFDDARAELLFVGLTGDVQVWDIKTNHAVAAFPTYDSVFANDPMNAARTVGAIAYDAARGRLVTGSAGATSPVVEAGKPFNFDSGIHPDPQDFIKGWDISTGGLVVIYPGPGAGVQAMSMGPDLLFAVKGRDIVHQKDGHLLAWNPTSGQLLADLNIGQDMIHAVALSPDGRKFAYSGGSDWSAAIHVVDLVSPNSGR